MKKFTLTDIGTSLVKVLVLAAAVVLASLLPASQAAAQACFQRMPLDQLLITSNFGMRKHPKSALGVRLHGGTDLRAKDAKLYAVESGLIVFADSSKTAGNMVQIRTNSGLLVEYFHLERIHLATIKPGNTVMVGQEIGISGKTGNTTTVQHLHIQVTPKDKGKGSLVDVRPYLCNPQQKSDAGPDPILNPNAVAGGPVGTKGVPNNDFPPMGSGPTAVTAAPQAASPMGGRPAATAGNMPAPQASSVPDYTGQSVQEFLGREATRRWGNPQWFRDLSDPLDTTRQDPDPSVRATATEIPLASVKTMIWKEILFMSNLNDFFAMEKFERNERIEQMMATDLADRVSEYSAQVLGALRAQAASR